MSGADRTGGALCVAGAVAAYFAWRAGTQAAALLAVRRVSKLSELEAEGALPELVAVRGSVSCDEPLRVVLPSETEPLLCALHKTVVKKLVAVRGLFDDGWTTRSRVVARTLRQAPFALQDASGHRIWLVNAATANGLRLVTVHRAVLDREPVPFWRAVLDAIISVLRGVVPLHTTIKQKALPVGARLTAVGLACRGADGQLVLRRPQRGPFYASALEVDELAAELYARRTNLLWWAAGFFAAGTAVVAYRAHARMLQGVAADAAAREEAERQAELEAEADDDDGGDIAQEDECTACYARKRSHVFTACGHLAVCATCSAKMTSCPLCRAPGRARKLYR